MSGPATFPFHARPNGNGPNDLAPIPPARLSRGSATFNVIGQVDSGSSFSVLPYDIGTVFGVSWGSLPNAHSLAGPRGPVQAKALLLDAVIIPFPKVVLLFAWAVMNDYPVLFGQANFFIELDVCFFRRRGEFHVQPATP